MFKITPKVLAHNAIFKQGNFASIEYILADAGNSLVHLHNRYCPHRMYPIADPGTHVENIIECNFHGFQWKSDGTPINNDRKIKCGTANVGRSGLVIKDFVEPDHRWVDQLAEEHDLIFSHSLQGESNGSWLWLMDAEADYLHVRKGGIHPRLAEQIDLEDAVMDQGDGWIFQEHTPGWWSLYIYPYVFVEHKKGCLSVNHVVPADKNTEWKFEWITQFYYSPDVTQEDRTEFETLETVFREDVGAIEKIKTKFFPVVKPVSKYEDHCVHWGQWVREQSLKN